jgi:nicotinamide-nucleotide amidase
LTRPRAVVVATGSELVRGDRTDLNGPFLARELLRLGFEPAQIVLVGDRPAELERALADAIEADFCAISGGLGPTHDDRTVELLAKVAGRPLHVDEALVREIGAVSRPIAERYARPYAEFEPGVRKQATLPEGALSLGLAGTAPGIVLGLGRRVAVALPGPPPELQRLWPRALETEPVRAVLARATPPRHDVLRLFGVGESVVARALDAVGGDGEGVDATICARDMEIHVDLFAEPGAGARADGLAAALSEALEPFVFATDERAVEEIVLALLRERGLTLATAESCTGGLVGERLTSVPGASDVFRGGIVAYANEVKAAQLGVGEDLLARHGAVSAEVAAAMADGARAALGVDVAVAVTGVAGPGGGTPDKPVGLVHVHAAAPAGGDGAELRLHGDRETIRRRATVAALHLLRTVAARNRHRDV